MTHVSLLPTGKREKNNINMDVLIEFTSLDVEGRGWK